MYLRSLSAFALVAVALAGCGDDSQAGGGGTPGDDDTSSSSDTSSSVSSSAASTSAASTSGASTSSSAASSSSTGEPGLCAWAGMDPGTLVATGNAIGDVIENVSGLVDQCGVARSLWDFAGGYRILSMTPGW